jgi:putative PIN family toxin of toxin-antitoxin system
MTAPLRRVVYDCNVFLQGFSNRFGPSGGCIQEALESRVMLFIDGLVIAEIRDVAARPKVRQALRLLPERVEELVTEIRKVAISVDNVAHVFDYPRDRDDAHYIDLAAAARAELVVSRDRDLLDLMGTGAEATSFREQFPSLRILDPASFLRELRADQTS